MACTFLCTPFSPIRKNYDLRGSVNRCFGEVMRRIGGVTDCHGPPALAMTAVFNVLCTRIDAYCIEKYVIASRKAARQFP